MKDLSELCAEPKNKGIEFALLEKEDSSRGEHPHGQGPGWEFGF